MTELQLRASRITLVEDDLSLLGALSFALEAEGYLVAAHANAAEAVKGAEPADCLVLDLKLPDTDGLALIGQLRGKGIDAPAILITTDPGERDRGRARAAGVDIVEKPLMSAELRLRIAAAIAGLARDRPAD
jgi:two-component system response regulator FixJ